MTTKSIDALPKADVRTRYKDDAVTGLALVVEPSGNRTWKWTGRIGGTVVNRTLGRYPAHTYADARDWALDIIRNKDRGVDIIADRKAEAEAQAIREQRDGQWLFDLWLLRECNTRNKASTVAEKKAQWARDLKGVIGALSIFDVKHDVLADLISAKAKTADIQANRLVALLKRMYKWATTRGRAETGLTEDPSLYLYKPADERKRDRALNDRELGYLLSVLETSTSVGAPAIRLMLDTGCRRGEVLKLPWPELDLVRGEWTIPGGDRTKNAKKHLVPLMPSSVAILQRQTRSNTSDLVFWSRKNPAHPISGMTKIHFTIFEATKALAALDGHAMEWWTLHDLRRTMSTVMSGVRNPITDVALISGETVEACLNHISGTKAGVAGVYNHHKYFAEKKAAYRHWHAHLDRCLAAEKIRAQSRGMKLAA